MPGLIRPIASASSHAGACRAGCAKGEAPYPPATTIHNVSDAYSLVGKTIYRRD